MAPTGTMTVTGPIPHRTVLLVDRSERVVVVRCAGTGPSTLTVRQVNRLDRLRWRIAALGRRMVGPITRRVKAWRLTRCDEHRCWRRAEPDVDENYYCRRHGGMSRSLDEG